MQIQSLANNPNKISFTRTNRSIYDSNDKFLYSNHSFFFRDDIKNWDKFADSLINKYKNQDKVNVYCHACSDGSEPYSLAMILLSKLGEEGAQKFFPIIAVDKDKHYLEKAAAGKIEVYEEDLRAVEYNTKKHYSEYMDIIATSRDSHRIKFKENVRNAVVFSQGDILDEIDSIKPDNSVLMFRNAWPYLKPNQRMELAEKINNNLGENSLYIMGSFDRSDSEAIELLDDVGLERIKTDNFIGFQKAHYKKTPSLNDPEYLYNVYAKKY